MNHRELILPELLALSAIFPSPDNPRKTIDPQALEELAGTIREFGVQQPIKVRPLPMIEGAEHFTYEIVFGERRWRGAGLAGLEKIPAFVEDMTEEHADKLRLIENLQREDVDPIEEAEAMVRLQQRHGYTIDQLAGMLGIGRTTAYDRMKLATVHPKVREQCQAGVIGGQIATYISRFPQSVQTVAMKKVMKQVPDPKKGPQGTKMIAVSAREAKDILQAGFTVKLHAAAFVTSREDYSACGSCTKCDNRSDNVEPLLADLGPDVCTDKECFQQKEIDHIDWRIADARARGIRIIEGDEAKGVMPHSWRQPEGYVLISRLSEYETPPGEDRMRDIDFAEMVKLTGMVSPDVILLINPYSTHHSDKIKEVVTAADGAALELAWESLMASVATSPDGDEDDEDGTEGDAGDASPSIVTGHVTIAAIPATRPPAPPPSPELIAVRAHWKAIMVEIVSAIRAQKRTTDEMRYMLMSHVDCNHEIPDFVAEAWGWAEELKDVSWEDMLAFTASKLEPMGADELGQLLVAFHIELANPHGDDERLALANMYGVDLVKVGTPKPAVKQASLALDDEGQPTPPAWPAGKPPGVKYRNPETGETWSGRGLMPKWLQAATAEGKTLVDFEVTKETA